MSDKFVQALTTAYKRLEQRSWIYGQLGKHGSGDPVIAVPGRPTFVWVTMRIANGGQTVVEARNDVDVSHIDKLAVKMKLENGTYVIYGKSGRQDVGVNLPLPPSGVPAHSILEHTDTIAASIEASAVKTTPVGGDGLALTDSEAGLVLKRLSWSDAITSIIAEVGFYISGLTAKATPIDADSIVITDSAAANVPKRTTLTDFKAFLKTYFDTLYDKTATIITALTTKATPVGADAIVITDSAAADVPKRVTFTDLGTYLSTLYLVLAGSVAQTVTGIKTFTSGIVTPSIDGSVAANGDVTIQGTTHSTRTSSYVLLQPNGGHVGVGTTTPGVDMVGTFDFDPATTRIFQVDGAGARLIARGATNVAFDFIQTDGATNAKWFLMQLNNGTAQFISLSDAIAVQKNLLILDLVTGNAGFGVTAPSGKVSIQAGSSSDHANAGGVLYVKHTVTGNVGTGVDVLATFSVPANTLAVNGQSLWFECWGQFAANANSKQVFVRWGGQDITFSGASIGFNNEPWYIRGRIMRTGAATQVSASRAWYTNISTKSQTLTLSSPNTFEVLGEGVTNNDITITALVIGWDDVNS